MTKDELIIEWIAEHLVSLSTDVNGDIHMGYVDSDGYYQLHIELRVGEEPEPASAVLKRAVIFAARNE